MQIPDISVSQNGLPLCYKLQTYETLSAFACQLIEITGWVEQTNANGLMDSCSDPNGKMSWNLNYPIQSTINLIFGEYPICLSETVALLSNYYFHAKTRLMVIFNFHFAASYWSDPHRDKWFHAFVQLLGITGRGFIIILLCNKLTLKSLSYVGNCWWYFLNWTRN